MVQASSNGRPGGSSGLLAALGLLVLAPCPDSEALARDGNPVSAPPKVEKPDNRGVVPIFGRAKFREPEPADPDLFSVALPPIDLPDSGAIAVVPAPWVGFFEYALTTHGRRAGEETVTSAILPANISTSSRPAPQPCSEGDSAVLIDIDPQGEAFTPQSGLQPLAGLAEALSNLRSNGIVVMWISRLGAENVNNVADALQQSGLDPGGRDPILLAFQSDESKQDIREDAEKSVCVLAIAGDRMGDFDELFDYLRNPADARYYNQLVSEGWFIVPPPFAEGQRVISGAFTPGEPTSGQISP